MLTQAAPQSPNPPTDLPEAAEPAGRQAWWVRLVARLPLSVLYGIASVLGWLSVHVYPHREKVVRENLTRAFPDFGPAQ